MSEEKICRCGHNYVAHTYEKMENGKVCDCFHCKECGKDQNGNFKCEVFCRVGSQTPEYRARIKAEKEASNKAQDDAIKKAQDEARKKAQDEARKKEKERLEKEQKEKERLEKEQKFKKEHRIQYLFHICHINNLLSIIDKGLFSRVLADSSGLGYEDIADQGISGRRDKPNEKLGLRLTTFASTYFEPINGMYWRVIPNEMNEEGIMKDSPKKIVIVEFKLDLSKEGIVITDGNAATAEYLPAKATFNSPLFVKIMSEIDELTIAPSYQGKNQWTDERNWKEHKRRKAAECLVPKNIRQDCITAIHIYNDPDVEKQVKSWIDNSRLPIEIILIPPRPTGIIRRENVI